MMLVLLCFFSNILYLYFSYFLVAPHVVLDKSAKENINLTVGESLNVSCNASHPDASTIRTQWTKDGETVNDVNGNLVIQSLSLNDNGVYTCSASFKGLGNNKSFSLTVIGEFYTLQNYPYMHNKSDRK